MSKTHRVAAGWRRLLATPAVLLLVVAASLAEDNASSKRPAKKDSTPLPEIIRSEDHEDVDGHSGKPVGSKSAGKGSSLAPRKLDDLILKDLSAKQVPISEPTNDEEFVRRAYLDVVGHLPNPGVIREFVGSRMPKKRAVLIEGLLTKPEFSENWARYWRDVVAFRSPNENDKQVNYPLFEQWLTAQFAAKRPWDEITKAIITATGRNDEVGATAFAMAEEGSAVEMAGEVSRVFMGVQIQCAQCHDHPSDPWKRQQFHEFAAFFTGIKSRRVEKQEKGKPAVFMVSADGPSHYSMPDLKHPDKKVQVSPRFFLNDAPQVKENVKADERLKLVANYVTDPENPWFARSFVNRIWYSLMGEGFYNPVDDLGPTRTPNSPEILELVSDEWVRSGFDVRWLFRLILNTEAYQRASKSTNTAAGRTPFASNVPSRLRADQIFDILTHALDLENERNSPVPQQPPKKGAQGKMAEKGKAGGREGFLKTFGIDPSTPSDDVLGTIPQALYLMNGPIITREVQARPNSMLGYLLMTHPDNRSVLEVIYLRSLGRRPTEREIRTCSQHLNAVGDRAEAFEDILWALLNSTEFLSRR